MYKILLGSDDRIEKIAKELDFLGRTRALIGYPFKDIVEMEMLQENAMN